MHHSCRLIRNHDNTNLVKSWKTTFILFTCKMKSKSTVFVFEKTLFYEHDFSVARFKRLELLVLYIHACIYKCVVQMWRKHYAHECGVQTHETCVSMNLSSKHVYWLVSVVRNGKYYSCWQQRPWIAIQSNVHCTVNKQKRACNYAMSLAKLINIHSFVWSVCNGYDK